MEERDLNLMAMWLKKRSRKLPILSPVSPLPPPRVPEMQQQSGDNMYSLSTRRNHKKAKLQKVVATTCQIRSWNEMDHDILVMIMNKLVKSLGWRTLDDNTMYFCKPWLLALLDALFPPGTTLDLHSYDKFPPDSYCNRARGRFCFFSTWRLVLFDLKTITPRFCLANYLLISFHGNILVQGCLW